VRPTGPPPTGVNKRERKKGKQGGAVGGASAPRSGPRVLAFRARVLRWQSVRRNERGCVKKLIFFQKSSLHFIFLVFYNAPMTLQSGNVQALFFPAVSACGVFPGRVPGQHFFSGGLYV